MRDFEGGDALLPQPARKRGTDIVFNAAGGGERNGRADLGERNFFGHSRFRGAKESRGMLWRGVEEKINLGAQT